ncbi:histidine kinase N-terminal 7TM domain-containing protein [Candidatus Omnitrophota bacterium]
MSNFILNQYFISLLVTGIVHFCLALIVLIKGIDKRLNQTYALYSFSISIWSIFEAFGIIQSNETFALWLWRINHAGVIFIPIFFVHFVYSLVGISGKKRKLIPISYLIACVFLILDATPLLIREVVPKFSFKYFINPGPFYYFFFSIWVGWAIYGLVEMFREYFRVTGYRRNQMRYFCWSMLVAYMGGIPNFFPTFNIEIPILMPFGTYAIPIYAFFTVYAIIKYRLLEVEVVIGRTAVFLFTQSFVFGIPGIMILFGRPLLINAFNNKWWVFPLITFGILAETSSFINTYLQRKFYSKQIQKFHNAQEALEVSGRGMIEIDDVHRLARIIPRYLTSFYYIKLRIKITHATIFLLDNVRSQYILVSSAGEERQIRGKALLMNSPLYEWFVDKRRLMLKNKIAKPGDIDVLRIDDVDYWMQNSKLLSLRRDMHSYLRDLKREMDNLKAIICVPSFFKGNLLGFLLLGNKSHGMYSEEELDLFSRLATNAAAAFRSAQLSELIRKFEEEKAETEKLISTGELLGSVRHEMGNLLNKIGVNVQVMVDAVKKNNMEKFDTLNKQIVQYAISAKDLWKQVDDYKKKSQANNIKLYSIRQVIDQAISSSNGLIEKWKISVYHAIDPRIEVKGRESLPEIFRHLLINACYGMETDGGDLSFAVNELKENNMIEIIQTDTGLDLTEEIKKHNTMGGELFAEQGKLGGIGLFLARRIIKDHHGTFDIHSNAGKGTKFIVRLPVDFTKLTII